MSKSFRQNADEREAETNVSVARRILPRALLAFERNSAPPWIEACLADDCSFVVAATVEEAVALVRTDDFEVVLADASFCTTAMLAALDERRLTRSTVYLVRPGVADERIQRTILRHEFSVTPYSIERESFRDQVRNLLFPRSQTRHPLSALNAELSRPDGSVLHGQVFDLSNRGLSIVVDARQGVMLPGEEIPEVALVRSDGRHVLSGAKAVVRHIQVHATGPAAAFKTLYKVGLEMRSPQAGSSKEADAIVANATRIEALLREALHCRMAVRTVEMRHPKSARLLEVDGPRQELRILCDALEPVEIGDVLFANFEFGGGTQSFCASLRNAEQTEAGSVYSLKLPRAVAFATQRRSARITPSPQHGIRLKVVSPFDGKTADKPVVNITSSGLAFSVLEGTDLFPVGTRFSDAEVVFHGGSTHRVSGVVKSLAPTGAGSESICGVEFRGLSAAERVSLADAVTQAEVPNLREGKRLQFDEIWNFFLETGFLYPEKLNTIEVDEAAGTMRRLLAAPPTVFKAALFGADDRIDAHVSGLHVYDKTWMVQHLAARPGGSRSTTRGRSLGLAVFHHIEQLPESEWIKIWFRPENRWPRRVCGEFAQRVNDPSLSLLRTYHYMVDSRLEARGLDRSLVTVAPATDDDLPELEAAFVARGDSLLLRSDDIAPERLDLAHIDRTYRQAGLTRRREVLAARRGGRPVGFALLEFSSAWLNLSQLTSVFRLVGTENDPEAAEVLLEHVRRRYREVGERRCIGLASGEQVDAFTRRDFAQVKRYSCWTWRRFLYHAFQDYVRRLGSAT